MAADPQGSLLLDWPFGTSGGSAGVNNIAWFTCPLCGATVSEEATGLWRDTANRRHHEAWHEAALSGSKGQD